MSMNTSVYKFGGTSLANASLIKNVTSIISKYRAGHQVIVISALGKTTNELEAIHQAAVTQADDLHLLVDQLFDKHKAICLHLFEAHHPVFYILEEWKRKLIYWTEDRVQDDPVFLYDQIVSMGEFLSSIMVSHYLQLIGVANQWLDARNVLHTDHNYREGRVDWAITQQQILQQIDFSKHNCFVVQGFIGGTTERMATTLGREGSDYTAAIIAACIHADEAVVWKDVPGVLNADPRLFSDAVKLDELSYYEAIEMTYYGAQVIHPKTLQPLQRKKIPLRVKSFVDPSLPGTLIYADEAKIPSTIPVIIFKANQLLVSVYTKDFSFIAEEHIAQVYDYLVLNGIKINLSQNSATNFSFSIDHVKYKTDPLLNFLSEQFRVLNNEGLQILTVRNFNESLLTQLLKEKEVILEQRTRHTIQLLLK